MFKGARSLTLILFAMCSYDQMRISEGLVGYLTLPFEDWKTWLAQVGKYEMDLHEFVILIFCQILTLTH